jgi:type I restriction-modification system DNA methylase subunit
MQDIFSNYIQSISSKFSHEETSEMGYRTDFEILIKGIFESIKVRRIDHDARAKKGNKPDFVVLSHDIPILYIEAKNISTSLDKVEKSEQMSRYFGYANLVLTDYTEFRFYRNGVRYEDPIKIANYDIKNRSISPIPEHYEFLSKTLIDFTQSYKEPIQSGEHLAKIMGGKAQRLRDNILNFFSKELDKNTDLVKLYETIKKLLVHDLNADSFADMYAQTLVYGLFVARYYDKTPNNFTRQEARELIPNSNRLLRHFFDHIVGADFDPRLKYIVDELCEVFSHADVAELMIQYFKKDSKRTEQKGPDPVIHFYEDFLSEYDPILRKRMGAYYTPLPVVQFIVRSVDYLLKKEFGLSNGLADSEKTNEGIHKVQVLDPAVGTGTFISAVIRNIYEKMLQNGQKGRWPAYVHHDLLPRLYGFELMMTPYTIAHLKLGIAFRQTGFWDFHRRLGIYLTNSLEESSIQQDMFSFGLAESIAEESKEASVIKNEKPIMVIVGNPPYNPSSSNKGDWIQNLIKIYKLGLGEQNINSLSDDYIKFIRFSEHFIEKNNSGIVAMITNNSFIDGIIFRQMRKHLLQTFDDIYIINLHGNSKKLEKAPDGGKDENVFDIQQGVSISIFVRKEGDKKGLGNVYHTELYGKRLEKFESLDKSNLQNINWRKLDCSDPYYFFVPKNFSSEKEYNDGFKLDKLFINFGSGIKFRKDNLLIRKHFDKESVKQLLEDINMLDDTSLYFKYDFKDTSDWKLSDKKKLFNSGDIENIKPVLYRPFDIRYTYYPLEDIAEIIPRGDSRKSLMKNMLNDNIALLLGRQVKTDQISHFFVTNLMSEMKTAESSTVSYHFPLFTFDNDGSKIVNLNKEIIEEIEIIVGKVKPQDVFDYIYAVLYSPSYREKYKEFLKIDFPRIPYPKNLKSFREFVDLGTKLRTLHLLKTPKVNQFITTYPIEGSDVIEIPYYVDGKVYINKDQYFGNVPKYTWDFYIGGYQPLQKWLKDRKGHTLTNDDFEHYQKMIVAIVETDRIMKKIDEVSN